MQRNEQNAGQPAASGIPGTASNAPNVKPPLYPAQSQSQQNLKQESATYGGFEEDAAQRGGGREGCGG